MMLTKNVCGGVLFYNTWEALVLLQVDTVVSWKFDSAVERFENKVLLIERSSSENNLLRLYLSDIIPVFPRR